MRRRRKMGRGALLKWTSTNRLVADEEQIKMRESDLPIDGVVLFPSFSRVIFIFDMFTSG